MRDNISLKREKKVESKNSEPAKKSPIPTPQKAQMPLATNSDRMFQVTIYLNTTLKEAIKNMIEGATQAGDYSGAQSISEFVRRALQAYGRGMTLSESVSKTEKRRFTLFLSEETKRIYDNLPSRKRTEIIERAIRSFLKSPNSQSSFTSDSSSTSGIPPEL